MNSKFTLAYSGDLLTADELIGQFRGCCWAVSANHREVIACQSGNHVDQLHDEDEDDDEHQDLFSDTHTNNLYQSVRMEKFINKYNEYHYTCYDIQMSESNRHSVSFSVLVFTVVLFYCCLVNKVVYNQSINLDFFIVA